MFQEFKNRFSGVFLLNIHLSWAMDYINLPPHGLSGSIKKKNLMPWLYVNRYFF